MKNPSNAYRMLDERTMLEALQTMLHEDNFDTDLWESEDDDGWWSLSVGPYEICMDADTKTFIVWDFDEKIFKTDHPMKILGWFNKKFSGLI